tara:strand:+ start:1197 stop:2090 length:894 start_codon:yes stop_codon:yes gene_type:complete
MVRNKKILVTGSSGQLGNKISMLASNYDKYDFIFLDKNDLDISNFGLVKKTIKNTEADVIINCAALTDVDKAENQNKLVDLVNHCSVKNLAEICFENNVQLIHISSDYVFDGEKNKPYLESDLPNPINNYGLSKFSAENSILEYNLKGSVIIRTSWVYSEFSNNFVRKIIDKINLGHNFSVVDNEFGSPTNASDLAKAILDIVPYLKDQNTEIYHFSNSGVCSRYDLAIEINRLLDGKSIISSNKSSNKMINRPKFSALNSNKIADKFKLNINEWKHSLGNFFKELDKNKTSVYESY